ncbi:unnamed protein product [Rotaria magnacalcarata]|uniref:Uncharacterized protein n=2 Tax=Rotaria magnacalcarata TaxID=392030 RepID=A0A819SSF4_9BILA|nr:unnamed protein product [Rotaria magnacalcarata]CAF4065941.1 unnamed protein product [Rotaria magnacalcarata]
MRVNKELSHSGYRTHHGQKYDDRFKRRNRRYDDYHFRSNRESSLRTTLKSRCHRYEEYSTAPSNRKDKDQLSSYENHKSSSSRFDHPTNNPEIYSPLLLVNQQNLYDGQHPDALLYKASQSMPSRGLTSNYIDSERNRYSSPPPVSCYSTYRRENTHSSPSSYRNEYISRNGTDQHTRNEYRSPTPPPIEPLPIRSSTVDSYKDLYRSNDYNNRSQQFNIESNRNNSPRAYHPIVPTQSSIHRSDSYRTSSAIRMSSHPPLSSSNSSSYVTHDQFTQSIPPMRENDYRIRDYGMTTSIDHRQIVANDYCLSSSYQDRSNLKQRSGSNFDDSEFQRPMRR